MRKISLKHKSLLKRRNWTKNTTEKLAISKLTRIKGKKYKELRRKHPLH